MLQTIAAVIIKGIGLIGIPNPGKYPIVSGRDKS